MAHHWVGLRRVPGVDLRPLRQRQAFRILAAAYLGIAGCAIFGAAVAVEVVLHYTAPHAPKGAPPC